MLAKGGHMRKAGDRDLRFQKQALHALRTPTNERTTSPENVRTCWYEQSASARAERKSKTAEVRTQFAIMKTH